MGKKQEIVWCIPFIVKTLNEKPTVWVRIVYSPHSSEVMEFLMGPPWHAPAGFNRGILT